MNSTSKLSGGYLYGIDIVRFACAVAVGVYHLTGTMPELTAYGSFGWIGVEIFFVISGLVIANSAHGATVRQFLVGRFLRLYPTAWCAAAVSYPIFLFTVPKHGRPILPLILSMTLIHGPFLAGAYWTLPIELSFYFLIFLLLWFKKFEHIQLFAIALVFWSAPYLTVLLLNTCGVLQMQWIDFGFGAGNMSLLRHGPFFALGILVWLFREKRISWAGLLSAACALILGAVDIYVRSVELFHNFTSSTLPPQPFWNHLDLVANMAFLAGFLGILLSVKLNYLFPKNITARKTVRLAGLTTYPFYLLHQRVGGYVSSEMLGLGVGHLTSVVIALLCTGGISALVALYGEPALRSLLKKIAPALRSSSGIDALTAQEKA